MDYLSPFSPKSAETLSLVTRTEFPRAIDKIISAVEFINKLVYTA